MMFGKKHWLHVAFFNRDPRENGFSEAHHGTYEITGPGRPTLDVDMELRMEPNTVRKGIDGSSTSPSTAQLVLERIE